MTCPRSTYKPVMGGFIGLWRIAGQWNEVRTENDQPFKTAVGALQAATDRMHSHWFPELRSANLECSKPVSDPLGVKAWKYERQSQQSKDQEQTFGTLFKRGRPIQVERRRKLAK